MKSSPQRSRKSEHSNSDCAIDSKDRVHEVQHEARGNGAAVSWLSNEFGPGVLAKHGAGQPGKNASSISLADQRRLLIERADAFSSVSSFLQATALREAALLLDESDWEQHVAVLGDYVGLIKQQVNGQYSRDRLGSALAHVAVTPELQPKLRPLWRSWWMSGASHLEWLAFANALSPLELLGAFNVFRDATQAMINMDAAKLELRERWTQVAWDVLEQIGKADAGLRPGKAAAVFDRLQWNSGTARTPADIYNQWAPQMFDAGMGLSKVSITPGHVRSYDDRETLANLDRVMERVLRRDFLAFNTVGMWLVSPQHPFSTLARSGRVPEAKLVEMLRRWSDDPRPDVSVYGRTLLLSLKASNAIREPKSPRDAELLTALQKQITDWYRTHPGESGTPSYTLNMLEKLRPQLAPGSAPVGIATKPGRQAPNSKPQISLTGGQDPAPRMTFEPLLDRRVDWVGIKRCSDKLDVAWSYTRVVLLPVGQPEIEIVKTDANLSASSSLGQQDVVCMVTGDADFVWVASSRSGVQVFDHQGQRLGRITLTLNDNEPGQLPSIGLPNINRMQVSSTYQTLWLHSLGNGRCFVAGKMGVNGRRRFGCLKPAAQQAEWRFKSWLELKQASPATVTDHIIGPTFEPQYFVDYREPSGKRSLLFGRPSKPAAAFDPSGSKPLAFDVSTGMATIFPHGVGRPTNHTGSQLPVDDLGCVLMAGMQGNSRAARQEDGSFRVIPLTPQKPIPIANDVVRRFPSSSTDVLLPHEDWFYWLWGTWHRVHRQTGLVEQLNERPTSSRFDFRHYGVSANFGIVAWNADDTLHRIHINKPRPAESELDWLYPFIPVAQRASHHAAVTEIRKLGGEVDSVPAQRPYSYSYGAKVSAWRTAVFLPATWNGGDEGLRHLGQLFDLHELFVFDAPLTNEGVTTIAEIPSLRTVMLGRTKVTNAGVTSLSKLPLLTELWLEPEIHSVHENGSGNADKSDFILSNECLESFAGHKTLRTVTLIDRGFGDAALKHLEKVQFLYELRLIETDLSASAINDFRKLRPQVRFVSDSNQ